MTDIFSKKSHITEQRGTFYANGRWPEKPILPLHDQQVFLSNYQIDRDDYHNYTNDARLLKLSKISLQKEEIDVELVKRKKEVQEIIKFLLSQGKEVDD